LKKGSKHRFLKLTIVVLLLYAAVLNIPNLLKLIYPLKFTEEIMECSRKYDLEPPMIAALIKTESNFDALAESGKGARGLMQITPSTGRWIAEKIGIRDYTDNMLYDPAVNIIWDVGM